ncbi:MAG: DNA repair protein RecO [Angelakisella sp.]
MQLSVDAVVIREKRLEEQDRLLTLLTRDKGVITAYAKGAARMKGGMVSSTEQLCYSHFWLFQNKERTFVDKAESDKVFFGIRQELEKLSLATYFCQLCCELVPPMESDEGYLRLMLNALHFLEKDKLPPALLKPLFELRILAMSGYMPDLVACSACGELEGEELWFSPTMGVLYCGSCRPKADTQLVLISKSCFEAMRHIIYSDFEKLFSFRLSQQSAKELGLVCRAYLLAQVERMLPALNYYETLCL